VRRQRAIRDRDPQHIGTELQVEPLVRRSGLNCSSVSSPARRRRTWSRNCSTRSATSVRSIVVVAIEMSVRHSEPPGGNGVEGEAGGADLFTQVRAARATPCSSSLTATGKDRPRSRLPLRRRSSRIRSLALLGGRGRRRSSGSGLRPQSSRNTTTPSSWRWADATAGHRSSRSPCVKRSAPPAHFDGHCREAVAMA